MSHRSTVRTTIFDDQKFHNSPKITQEYTSRKNEQMAPWRHVFLLLPLLWSRITINSAFLLNPINCASKTTKDWHVRVRLDLLNYYSSGVCLTIHTCVLSYPMSCVMLKLPEKTFSGSLFTLVLTHRHTWLCACSNRCPHFLLPPLFPLSLSSCLCLFSLYLALLCIPVVRFRVTVFPVW